LPALLVEGGDGGSRQIEVVGQKHQQLACFSISALDPADFVRVLLEGDSASKIYRLVTDESCVLVNRMRIDSFTFKVRLGPGDKEGQALGDLVQPSKVHISPVHHMDGAGLDRQHIQNIDVMQFAVRDLNECRNIPTQVKERVHLDSSLGLAEMSPREYRQAQIDRG